MRKRLNNSEIIKKHINDINKQLTILRRTKFWGFPEYRKLDCLPEMISTLKEWSLKTNSYNKEMRVALFKLSNEIFQLTKMHESKIYPYGKYIPWTTDCYKKKFRENVFQTIDNFEKGNDNALFQLLKFDGIHWLYSYPIKMRILMAEANEDDRFFNKLANVLRYGSKKRITKGKKDGEWLRIICEHIHLMGVIDFNNNAQVNELYEGLVDYFLRWERELKKIPNNQRTKKDKANIRKIKSISTILDDKNYFFHKWLKRHQFRKDTKKLT